MENIMKKTLLSLLSATTLFCVVGNASADSTTIGTSNASNLKIAVVDMQQVLQKSTQIKTINDQLTKQFKPRQDKIIAEQKALQDEANKLNKDGSVMSADSRGKLQDKIIKERADLQGVAVAFQRDVSAAQNQAMQTFMTKFNSVVATVAKNNNFDLVLQRAGVPYVKDNLDITKQIIDELNK